MKKYPTTVFAEDIWLEIGFIFWRENVPCLPPGISVDNVEPFFIETTKRGIEISGIISFLPTGKYDLYLCLAKPGFPSIESVSVTKLRRTAITDCALEDRTLKIVVTETFAG